MGEKLSPILGLPVDDDPVRVPLEHVEKLVYDDSGLQISVIVPARNEERRLGECLRSLLAQDDALFPLGTEWELIVVDDASTDDTWRVMQDETRGHAGVELLRAPALDPTEFTGKSAACWFGAEQAKGKWLVFTDADTIHQPKDLLRALYEARKHDVKLLSYSPRQVVRGLAQRVLMPLVFSELASVYSMAEVNDPAKRLAAANGQFLLVERETYFAVGGHRAVGRSVLEDVELAWNVKRASTRNGGRGIRFRYAPDALSTRMYEGFSDMVEGWTKNLALLFPHALQLAAWRTLDVLLLLLPVTLWIFPYLVTWQKLAVLLLWLRTGMRFYRRVARSNFPLLDCAITPLGLPLFVGLLLRSWMQPRMFRHVVWKGREVRIGK